MLDNDSFSFILIIVISGWINGGCEIAYWYFAFDELMAYHTITATQHLQLYSLRLTSETDVPVCG